MESCQGCGLDFKSLKGGLCKTCRKLKKAGAFESPPYLAKIIMGKK